MDIYPREKDILPISQLYTEYAKDYFLIANDRNFTREVDTLHKYIIQFYNGISPKLLELFAGPAYHGRIFKEKYNCKVKYVDSSPDMKKLILDSHLVDESEYYCGILPNYLHNFNEQFDAIVIMRYSLGYLSLPEVEQLISNISKLLTINGVLFIELHKIDLLVENLDSLEIKKRSVDLPYNNRLDVTWPNGKIVWDSIDFVANMNVLVEKYNDRDELLSHQEFISTEHIHTLPMLELLIRKYMNVEIEVSFNN